MTPTGGQTNKQITNVNCQIIFKRLVDAEETCSGCPWSLQLTAVSGDEPPKVPA